MLYLVGCVSVNLPTKNEINQILEGQQAIVLLKVNASRDGKPIKPFKSDFAEFNAHFGLGNFKTGGKPKPKLILRFLSQDSREEGWTYFVLEPEIYYLIIYPIGGYGRSPEDFPRWKFTIPNSSKYIYIGTANYSYKNSVDVDYDSLTIGNDSIEAGELISKYLSAEEKELTVNLMQKYESGPIELRRPVVKE